ncbi:hypothetical protein AQI88_01355 [Streptomyces cellostaticus]|uniref:Uncharacterized protein n=1 Tax=Streptomyces cellostaticus TaxID=67285 RepID=A0A117PZ54_9ACTN|nr:hypothetical protein AQI88_01355 [Streptomyces cellostaticus]
MPSVVKTDAANACLLHESMRSTTKLIGLKRMAKLVDHDIATWLVGVACGQTFLRLERSKLHQGSPHWAIATR